MIAVITTTLTRLVLIGAVLLLSMGCHFGLQTTPGFADAPASRAAAEIGPPLPTPMPTPSPTPTMFVTKTWVEEVAVPTSGDVRCFVVKQQINLYRDAVVIGWCGAELDLIGQAPVSIIRSSVSTVPPARATPLPTQRR